MSVLFSEQLMILLPILIFIGSIGLIIYLFFANKKNPVKTLSRRLMTICMIVIGFAGVVAGVSLFFRNYTIDQKIKTIDVKNTAVAVTPPVSGDKIYLRIFKQEGILEIWYKHKNNNYQLYRTWDICTYSGGLGPKKAEGDGKSPEGFYATEKNLLKPNSNYHLAFNIGYPNAYDRAHGYTGSFIMIHGNCVSIGCYAMTDKGIEQIYAVVNQAINSGQKRIPIHIFPFRMTASNMQKFQNSAYMPFWSELKPAYDIFQSERRVADITVHNKHYVIK